MTFLSLKQGWKADMSGSLFYLPCCAPRSLEEQAGSDPSTSEESADRHPVPLSYLHQLEKLLSHI